MTINPIKSNNIVHGTHINVYVFVCLFLMEICPKFENKKLSKCSAKMDLDKIDPWSS
jgi:hypothetical protein